MIINTKVIEKAIYNLCTTANTVYSQDLYDKINTLLKKEKNTNKITLYENIIKNANLAYQKQRPLCQDTGQVIVFVKIGQSITLEGSNINTAINNGVKKAYKDNFYRKSTVKNSIFDRTNTNDNTPAIIYTEITNKKEITLQVLIKGAGSENYSAVNMFSPATTEDEIIDFIKTSVQKAGEKACPPLVLGIGIGGTIDKATILSKQAFFEKKNSKEEKNFLKKLEEYLKTTSIDILATKIKTTSTHIASMPVALTINCHSCRHAECIINENGIKYSTNTLKVKKLNKKESELKEIKTTDIKKLRKLKKGEQVFLTGEIYTARDAAHKKLKESFDTTGKIAIPLKDKIIFYAGPCPAAPNEIIGPIGPTTATRMDTYTEMMYSNGLFATIGKGERTEEATTIIKNNKGKYFIVQGGIACLLADCVKKAETIAFEELGTEAIRKLYIEKLPIKVEI